MDADPAGAARTSARSNGSRSAAHGPILFRFVLLNSVYPKEDFKPKFFKIGQFLDFREWGYLLIERPSYYHSDIHYRFNLGSQV